MSTQDTPTPAVSIALLREAIGRSLLETYDDTKLGTITECAKWTGTAIFDFMEAGFRDLSKPEAIVGCRMLGNILLEVAGNLEDAAVPAMTASELLDPANGPFSESVLADLYGHENPVAYTFRNSCEPECPHVLNLTPAQAIELAAMRAEARA